MNKVVVILLIIVFAIARWVYIRNKCLSTDHLLISLFIQLIPYGFGYSFFTFLGDSLYVDEQYQGAEALGAFGNSFRLEVSFGIVLIMSIFNYKKYHLNKLVFKNYPWLYILAFLCFISFINPINPFPLASFTLLFSMIQLALFINVVKYNFDSETILKGVYDGLMVVCIVQIGLTICYPILNLESVTTFFRGESAGEWAQRREGYPSAVGTFNHPAILAMFCLVSAVFFLACYLNKYKMRKSQSLLIINLVVIFFTFSRTTYISCLVVFVAVFLIFKQKGHIFSFKNLITFLLAFSTLISIFYLSPLSDLFLKSDGEEQVESRVAHWILALEMWDESKLIGVGINSHVYYMAHCLSNPILPLYSFLVRNPVHNIHLIVLAELGLVGISIWFYFFCTRFISYSKYCNTINIKDNIFNITFVGLLISFFAYGFFGWAPFNAEIYTLCILLGCLANKDKAGFTKNS